MRSMFRNQQRSRGWRALLWFFPLVLGSLGLISGSAVRADTISITAVSAGGGSASGGAFVLGATVGQAVVGMHASASYEGTVGFWRWTPEGVSSTDPTSGPNLRTHLAAAAPNPFRQQTNIRFDLALEGPARTTLRVIDVGGRTVASLVDSELSAGTYSYSWDGHGRSGEPLPSGVYFMRFRSQGHSETQRVVLHR